MDEGLKLEVEQRHLRFTEWVLKTAPPELGVEYTHYTQKGSELEMFEITCSNVMGFYWLGQKLHILHKKQ